MRSLLQSVAVTILSLILGACATAPAMPSAPERQALAPTGKLRVGLFTGQPVHSVRDPATGEYRGIAIDLGREMARRLGVPMEIVPYGKLPEFLGSAPSGQWDIAFGGIVPERRKDFEFGPPYARMELGYLVGGKTAIRTMAGIDEPGVRVAVPQRGAADTYLSKSLRRATLVRTPAVKDAVDLVRKGEVEAMAAVKTFLYPVSDRLAGSRVLDGMIAAEDVTIAVVPGNAAGAAFVRRFIEDAKASGLVRAAMDKARVRGLIAVP